METNSLSIGRAASAALALKDLEVGSMIDPRDYAEAIKRTLPVALTIKAVHNEKGMTSDVLPTLYEIKIGDRLMARLPKDQALTFLDGVIMGIRISRAQ